MDGEKEGEKMKEEEDIITNFIEKHQEELKRLSVRLETIMEINKCREKLFSSLPKALLCTTTTIAWRMCQELLILWSFINGAMRGFELWRDAVQSHLFTVNELLKAIVPKVKNAEAIKNEIDKLRESIKRLQESSEMEEYKEVLELLKKEMERIKKKEKELMESGQYG
jgi:PII-like signaling protein